MTVSKKTCMSGAFFVAMTLVASLVAAQPKGGSPSTTKAMTSKMDITEKQASEGAGAVFALAESRMGSEGFGQVRDAMPEAGELLDKSGLQGKVGSMPDLMKTMRGMGLSRGQVREFIGNLVSHVREVAGPKIAELIQGAVKAR